MAKDSQGDVMSGPCDHVHCVHKHTVNKNKNTVHKQEPHNTSPAKRAGGRQCEGRKLLPHWTWKFAELSGSHQNTPLKKVQLNANEESAVASY